MIPFEKAKKEILESKSIIEKKLSKACSLFCYPHGRYNKEIIEYLKGASFSGAVTIEPGLATLGDNRFTLKRNSIDSSNGREEFKGKLGKSVSAFYFLKNIFKWA